MAIALYALAALLCGLGVFALRRAWARRNERHRGAADHRRRRAPRPLRPPLNRPPDPRRAGPPVVSVVVFF